MTENEHAPMNEAEKELCGQLADALFLRCNDDDSWSQTAREKLLPIIRSYANALVAAAVSECVQHQAGDYNGGEYDWGCVCGAKGHNGYSGEPDTWADHIHSAVTPESAAKELERIKNEARLEGMERAARVCDMRKRNRENSGRTKGERLLCKSLADEADFCAKDIRLELEAAKEK